MTQDLLELVKDGVAMLTLNRPDRLNAMSRPMLDALLEALPRLAADPEVGAVVLTGAGRAFCAGGDVKAMAEGRESEGTTLEERAQALRLGLANRVVPDARLEEETLALARRLAGGPRVALRYMKRNFNAAETGTLKDALDLEAWHHTRCGMTEDHREAAKAFVEKREPVFRGR